MRILMITPAPPGSRAGNRATAERWLGLLEQAGHRVKLVTNLTGTPDPSCDLLIALHAWRSHRDVEHFRKKNPSIPLVVALTGTDIYDYQFRFPEETLRSMEAADCLIGLHHRVDRDIPERFGDKLVTVLQSADQMIRPATESDRSFQVCVIGHLRDEKDSLRAAIASRLLTAESRILIVNAGKAHTPEWQSRAVAEQASNPRFEWRGELGRSGTAALMRQSQLMVISSVMEGGANVVSEACRAGLPILASDISGNIGLLGDAYPGYFRTGDQQDLARLLTEAETSPAFLRELTDSVGQLAHAFMPEKEQESLAVALDRAIAHRAKVTRSG